MLHHTQNSPWWSMVTRGGWLCVLSLTLAEYVEHLRISTAVHSVQQEFWKANETPFEFNKYAHVDAYANSFQQNVLLKDLLRVKKKKKTSIIPRSTPSTETPFILFKLFAIELRMRMVK